MGAVLLPAGAAAARSPLAPPPLADVRYVDPQAVIDRYAGVRPASWGTRLPGVLGRAPVRTVVTSGRSRPVACLTFDACGNPQGGAASLGYDAELVEYLQRRRIPATLFISFRWAAGRVGRPQPLTGAASRCPEPPRSAAPGTAARRRCPVVEWRA